MLAYLDTAIGFSVVMLCLSLLIMILTQVVSAILSNRGANLRWGLAVLFRKIDPVAFPALAANAEPLAEAVLTHVLTSDSLLSGLSGPGIVGQILRRWQLASAIRGDELVKVLSHIAANPPPTLGGAVAANINALLGADNPNSLRQMQLLATTAAVGPAALPDAVPLIKQTADTVREPAGNLESWFHALMDRISQRFSMQMRVWTIVFAFAVAFTTGLDSIALLREIYAKGAFRQSLVGAAGQVTDIAQKLIPAGAKTSDQAAQMALSAFYNIAATKALANAKLSVPPGQQIKTDEDARQLIAKLATDSSQRTAIEQDYQQQVAQGLQQNVANGEKVLSILHNSGFDLFAVRWNNDRPLWVQFLGVLATAALLSLGAPFWFNSLKSLTNLRPILANNQKTEENARRKPA